MEFLILFTVLFTNDVWCRNIGREIPADYTDDKIVGGNDTTIESLPYQAYLSLDDGSYNYDSKCGGSIISTNYVVTAAHCLVRMRTGTVRIGSTDKNNGGTQYPTNTFVTHPRYNPRTKDYDLGLVRVDEGMNLDGTTARAITIVGVGTDPQAGETFIISGWGNTAQAGTSSNTLKVARVPVVSRTRCDELLPKHITSRMVCAGYDMGGVDTCQGDSGGPAVLARNGKLAGVTSFGYGCGQPNSPGVYTSLGQFELRMYILHMTGV